MNEIDCKLKNKKNWNLSFYFVFFCIEKIVLKENLELDELNE
jgi:hypothetical protein